MAGGTPIYGKSPSANGYVYGILWVIWQLQTLVDAVICLVQKDLRQKAANRHFRSSAETQKRPQPTLVIQKKDAETQTHTLLTVDILFSLYPTLSPWGVFNGVFIVIQIDWFYIFYWYINSPTISHRCNIVNMNQSIYKIQ